MFLSHKTLAFLLIIQVVLFLSVGNVLGEAVVQPDELWVKAVQLASENQNLIPENVHMQIKEFNSKGKVKGTEESWLQFFETDNGKVDTKLVKKLQGGKEVTDSEKEEKGNRKKLVYSSGLSDFTLPFSPKTQPSLTVKRLDQIETKAGRDCLVYDYKCVTSNGDNVVNPLLVNMEHASYPLIILAILSLLK